jgi:glutathione peroxidase
MLPHIDLQRINGTHENLKDYSGKVLLIVNVASKCGFTPQYRQLQALYDELQPQGLEILAFPCNQFGRQESGSAPEIENFCQLNYGVTFPVFQKIDVNGPGTHAIFTYLKSSAPGVLGSETIKWNFTKFLLNRDGLAIQRYAPITSPKDIRSDIQKLL